MGDVKEIEETGKTGKTEGYQILAITGKYLFGSR
jgi:hypothetical protein